MEINREKLAQRGSIVGIVLNLILATGKLFTGFLTGSLAIMADGIDSATDIATSFLTLIAAKISNRPADASHPYGHERAETIITKVLSFVILYAGFEVFTSAVSNLMAKERDFSNLHIVLIVSFISFLAKIFLYKYKLSIGKKINSSSFIADAYNMKNDIFTSASIFIGILIFFITGFEKIDAILALIVSIFIFKVGIEMFMETSNEIMDGSKELGDIYSLIVKTLENHREVKNPHKIRVRKNGFVYFIDMHLEVDENMTVREANEICAKIEEDIISLNNYIKDVTIHIEPIGNMEKEQFGHNLKTIKKTFGNKE
jgi:cation diffusion facilitator family transporter